MSEYLDVAVRAYTQSEPRNRRRRSVVRPRFLVVLDTETTTDETQRLLFGSFRAYRVDWAGGAPRLRCAEEGLIHASELAARDPGGFAVLGECARVAQPAVDRELPDAAWQLWLYSQREFANYIRRVVFEGRAQLACFNFPFDLSRFAIAWRESAGQPGEFRFALCDLLTPRSLEIPLGKRERIVAEVTDDEGRRATDVYLTWTHDADDPMIVRIRPNGFVTGNRVGRTAITAGAGDPSSGGVWARIPVEVMVVPNPEEPDRGKGFPRLLLTGRDIDPSTDEVREGDPDAPCLWQEPTDYIHNVWWLNLQSPEAAFAFGQRDQDSSLWRLFHVGRSSTWLRKS